MVVAGALVGFSYERHAQAKTKPARGEGDEEGGKQRLGDWKKWLEEAC